MGGAVDECELNVLTSKKKTTAAIFAMFLFFLVIPMMSGDGNQDIALPQVAIFQLKLKNHFPSDSKMIGHLELDQFSLTELKSIFEDLNEHVMSSGVVAAVSTSTSEEYFGVKNALTDKVLHRTIKVSHGFKNVDAGPEAVRCVSGSTCLGVVGDNQRENILIQQIIRELSSTFIDDKCDKVKVVNSSPRVEEKDGNKKRKHVLEEEDVAEVEDVTEVAVDEVYRESVSSVGYFKLSLLWLTRVLGFVYPAALTRDSLLSSSNNTGGWRAYWTIFSFVCFLEDTVFKYLVFLFPIYLISKILFTIWCLYPGLPDNLNASPSNSLWIYNIVFRTLAKLRGGDKEKES